MINLLKYEFKKKYKVYAVILIAFIILNVFFKLTQEALNFVDLSESVVSFAVTIIFSFSLTILAMVSVINNLRLEVKNPTRNLYFSLPISTYKKLGSKMIVAIFEISAAIIIGGLTSYGFFNNMVGDFRGLINEEVLTKDILPKVIEGFVSSLSFSILMLLIVYFSIVFYRAFLSQVKFGKVISFVLYFGILFLTLRYPIVYLRESFNENSYLYSGSLAIISIILFFIVGYLLDKKTNFD